MQNAPVTRVALYVRNLERVASFYEVHFGFRRHLAAPAKIILFPRSGGCAIVLLQASRGHRVGQSSVKIVFDVTDVRAFRASRAKAGLKFGVVHRGPGYEFANARDPAKNPVQISDAYLRDPQAG